jgi:hypothetical protein
LILVSLLLDNDAWVLLVLAANMLPAAVGGEESCRVVLKRLMQQRYTIADLEHRRSLL